MDWVAKAIEEHSTAASAAIKMLSDIISPNASLPVQGYLRRNA